MSSRPVLHYFGDYELLEEIARGGMGVVYRARQASLNRTVAVKVLLFGQFASDEFVRRFRAEAESAANLQHPNVVAIHEIGEHDGRQYFSMDYVEGGHLGELVREQPLSARRAASLLKTIAEAVHYAHQRGVLHRDLKPSNILIDPDGQPRLTDFGLAKRLEAVQAGTSAPEDLTVTGQMLGTPSYASPEQAGGRRGAVTAVSDVYSLGAILYFLLTGRPPFLGESLEQILDRVLNTDPIAPRLLNPSTPRDLETICLKSLEKEPRKRYGTAQEMADELGRFLINEPIRARSAGTMGKVWRWCRRKPALAAAIAAIHLVGAAGLAGIVWQWRRTEAHATSETAQRLRAEEAVTSLELQRAEDLLEKDEIVMAIAYLSRMVRQQPTNRIVAQRLLSALIQRNFALPIGPPLQHNKKVNYAEFSPDGRRAATASLDFTARIWDARTGEPLTPPMVHPAAVRVCYFSPDGQRLLTFADDFQARLWEVETGRALGQPMSHTNRCIGTAEFSPDGRRVVTASDDTTVRIWDGITGQPLSGSIKHHGVVRSTHFSPDGRRIVTACEDGSAQVWDAVTAEPVVKLFHYSAGITGAEFSPDGKWVVTAAKDFSTCVWDVTSGEPLAKPLAHADEIDTASFSPEGERIIVALHNGSTRIFNARDWAPLTQPMQHRDWTTSVGFGPEAQRVLSGSLDNTARLWDAENGEPLSAPMQHEGLVWSAGLSPDGLFAVTASADGTARLWDVRLGAAWSAPMNHGAPLQAAEFSPDGAWVVTAARDNTARIWDARTGQPRGLTLQHSHSVVAAQFSPTGDRVATASSDGTARIWNAGTGQPVSGPLRHGNLVTCLQFSPDGQLLVTAGNDATARIWSARTGEPHGEPIQHRSSVTFVCFSPDGQRLLSADSLDDRAQLRDVATGRVLTETPAREGRVLHGEFSPDGQRVSTASADGIARIWNAHTLQPVTAPMRGRGSWRQARFSRDGRWVVTASENGMAQVWNSQTGQPMGEPMRHRAWVDQAEFSPNGEFVVTASYDGTARLWDARTGWPVAEPFQHGGKVRSAHFSPDGRQVLTASQTGSAHIWDVPSLLPVHQAAEPPAGFGVRQSSGAFDARGNQQRQRTAAAPDAVAQFPGLLLADLAEALIGKRINAQGALENVSPARLGELRQRVSALPRNADFTRWLAWFLADRSTRTISPNSAITVPEYVARRMEEKILAAAHEAVLLAPTNAPALAHLAEMLLISPGSNAPVVVAEAGFLIRRAETLAPSNASVQESCRRIASEIERRSTR